MILNETLDNDYLKAIRNGTLQQGLGIDCDLDNYLLYKQGNFNVLIGHSNVGKTDWIVWYMVCHAVKHSLNWLIFSSENRIGSIKRKIIEYKTGNKLEDLSEDDFNKSNTWLNFKFKFVDTSKLYTGIELLDIFKQNKDQFDGAIIDPYNSLKRELKGKNSHDFDYEYASEIRLFCQNNNKSIYIIAHGVTEALRKTHTKDHPYNGHTTPLNAADVEGGGKWVNRADDFIVLHRYTQHEHEWMNTQVHVRKIKETETGGKPTFIDDPVICSKLYQSFRVKAVNPITDHTHTEKPLTPSTDFDNSVEVAKQKMKEDIFDKDPEEEIPF